MRSFSVIYCALCLLSVPGISQEFSRVLSFQELFDEIIASPDSSYRLSNAEIVYDSQKDHRFRYRTALHQEDLRDTTIAYYGQYDKITIDKQIILTNIKFSRFAVVVARYHFTKPILIRGADPEQGQITWYQCTFEEDFTAHNTGKYLRFFDCLFNGDTHVGNLDKEIFLQFKFTDFKAIFRSTDTAGYIDLLRVYSFTNANSTLLIQDCNFESATDFDVVDLLSGSFAMLRITDSNFATFIRMTAVKVAGNFVFSGNTLDSPIDLDGVGFPIHNSEAPWEQLQGNKITVGAGSMLPRDFVTFTAETDSQLADRPNYRRLMSAYSKLLNLYRFHSDRESYNSCFREMKDTETRRFNYLYRQQPGFQTFFDWQINVFLRAFSDYGTRPAKAILMSFYVICFFAVIYFFVPNSWDTLNRTRLMRHIRLLINYFRSKEGIRDLYEKEQKAQFENYEEFRRYLENSEKEIPFYFSALGRPLYHFSMTNYRFASGILKRTEILKGKWSDLPPGRQTYTSIIMGIWLIGFVLISVFIKALNAFTLSMNTFTTLGFGDIPIRGIARYLAILEGFIGWFMLTIFSVSLIGQILK